MATDRFERDEMNSLLGDNRGIRAKNARLALGVEGEASLDKSSRARSVKVDSDGRASNLLGSAGGSALGEI